jgi:HSP90 family molecular chaperone
MTGQKRKSVSPERKPPLSRNKREPDRIVAVEPAISKLQNLSQNRYLEDQYDRFGKHVARQLRELPLRSFGVLQEKIQSLLTNERVHCMNTPSSLASYVSSEITSPSESFATYEESDASSAANVTCDDYTSDDISKYIQL